MPTTPTPSSRSSSSPNRTPPQTHYHETFSRSQDRQHQHHHSHRHRYQQKQQQQQSNHRSHPGPAPRRSPNATTQKDPSQSANNNRSSASFSPPSASTEVGQDNRTTPALSGPTASFTSRPPANAPTTAASRNALGDHHARDRPAGGTSPPPPPSSPSPSPSPPLYTYTAEDIEPVLLAMVVSLVPYAPQAVRVSYVYQALQVSWRELVKMIQAITTTVDTFHQRRRMPSCSCASERGPDWWDSWALVINDAATEPSSTCADDERRDGNKRHSSADAGEQHTRPSKREQDQVEHTLGSRVRSALRLHSHATPSFSHGLPYTAGATPWYSLLPLRREQGGCVDKAESPLHTQGDMFRLKRLWEIVIAELDAEKKMKDEKNAAERRRMTADAARLDLSEAPRRCIREHYGSLREFLRVHSNWAASMEAACERRVRAEKGEVACQADADLNGDALATLLHGHPLLYSGLFLSQDGLFVTRALSRADAGVAFSVFYSLLVPLPASASPHRSLSRGRVEEEEEDQEDDFEIDADVRVALCERRCASALPPLQQDEETKEHSCWGRGTRAGASVRPSATSSSCASLFSCRPLMEVESLLECAIPFDFEPPPAPIPVISSEASEGGAKPGHSTTEDGGAAVGEALNVFTPEMLVPILPSYFVPMHRLGPRLPPGYTPAHVRELFGRMTKHVETVTLPPLPAPAADSGVYLRLHEGLRENHERVVRLCDATQWDAIMRIHHAPDYMGYRPNPALLNVFRALFLVPAPSSPRPTISSASPTTTTTTTRMSNSTTATTTTTDLSHSPAHPHLPVARVIRNEWLPLRDVVERAPRHVREALLPLRASHTLLFFAQMQHHFQFSPENGGVIRLAGNVNTPSGITSENSDDPLVQLGVLGRQKGDGVALTGLGRHNTPTPIAVSEVAALLQKQGCVYVADLERCRTFGGEDCDKHLLEPWAGKLLRRHRDGGSGLFSPSVPIPRPSLLLYLMNRSEEMEEEEGEVVVGAAAGGRAGAGAGASVSPLFLSDFTKREILHFYGSLRRFLAVHHGEVFSLRLAPLPAAAPEAANDKSDCEGNEHGDDVDEPTARGAKRARRGFANTVELESADFVQQIPAEALMRHHRTVGAHQPSSLLDSPRLMVELWSKYEERQAASNAQAAASGAGGGSIGMGSLSTSAAPPGAAAGASRSASSSPYLSSAALSALTLEQQLEYAFSIHDRRRIQKLRRQIAQRNDPEAAYTDTEVLFEAFLRYLPPARHISLRFLLRHLPTSITDFLPSNMTTWLKRFESQGRIQMFEYKFRHHIHLLRPGLPLPDGALRKTFTDDELVRIVAGDIQQRHPRPARMAFLYGALPLGAKETVRTKYKTLQTFLMRYPEHFIIIAESKSERSSLVKVLNPPSPMDTEEGSRYASEQEVDWGRGDGGATHDPYVGGLTGSPSEADLQEEEARERALLMQELGDELKESMRWH